MECLRKYCLVHLLKSRSYRSHALYILYCVNTLLEYRSRLTHDGYVNGALHLHSASTTTKCI